MAPRDLAVALLFSSFALFIAASFVSGARRILASSAFFVLLSGGLAFFANWAPPQARVLPPPSPVQFRQTPAEELTTAELAYLGELIIFGEGGTLHGQGKGQCPLCHAFKPGDVSKRAPSLLGVTRRAAERVTEPRYLNPDTVQTESFPGSGRARTADEYIAESHICPSCYVAEGYGIKGSNDRESPMVRDHLPPIALTLDEMIAVHTFLFVHDGEAPPSPSQIRADHQRFLPPGWKPDRDPAESFTARQRPILAVGSDTPVQIIAKLGCGACHAIPSTAYRGGSLGPVLVAQTTASQRLASAEYQALVKAGKAHATTPKEYIIESIMHPNAYVPSAFVDRENAGISTMPGYSGKLTYEAADKLADFLLSLDENAAARDNLQVGRVQCC